jgi:tetraacyldisaccharide 4'-kinase
LIVDSGLLHTLGIYRAAPVPIIIVGNIRVGGTGKTPLVIALANELVERGFKPGVISRGYQPNTRSLLAQPTAVNRNGNPNEVGDEPVLMSQRIHDSVPIWVYRKRKACIDALLQAHSEVNVIISDDGLQHAVRAGVIWNWLLRISVGMAMAGSYLPGHYARVLSANAMRPSP